MKGFVLCLALIMFFEISANQIAQAGACKKTEISIGRLNCYCKKDIIEKGVCEEAATQPPAEKCGSDRKGICRRSTFLGCTNDSECECCVPRSTESVGADEPEPEPEIPSGDVGAEEPEPEPDTPSGSDGVEQ